MTSEDLQINHHFALLELRAQDRIVQSDLFVEAWNFANIKQRRACHRLLRRLEIIKLKIWISSTLSTDLSAQRIRTLRQLASNHRISGYCNMSKAKLLKILLSKGIT